MCRAIFVLLLSLMTSALPCAAREPQVQLRDANGKQHQPLAVPAKKHGAVLVFALADCPAANKAVPELNRLARQYPQFSFYLVLSEPDLRENAARAYQQDYQITFPVLLDDGLKLAARLDAEISPEAVVIGPSGTVQYRGRINDLYQRPGRVRAEPTSHDLADALQALAAGKTPPVTETKPVGCYLPRK